MPTTTSYSRGAVVLLPFPFSDQSAVKLRPAVVANPAYPSDDLIVVALSSVAGALRPGEYPLQFWREAVAQDISREAVARGERLARESGRSLSAVVEAQLLNAPLGEELKEYWPRPALKPLFRAGEPRADYPRRKHGA